ncbi:MAG: prepilin-type N-terminal cleavage/methylation domain-containing protein, partial [Gammaproteobacteria bacterium]|nr:prepilin-type N-terminal cleavage/methylation domain-containing protein [Gammaproteobacteria bacterium]
MTMQGLGKCSIPTDRGFTLVELMVVVGLIALVMTQGIPWLESTTLNSRRAAQINAFVADLNAARGLAVAGDDVTFGVHG